MSPFVIFLLGFLLLLVVALAVAGVVMGVNTGLCGLEKGSSPCGDPVVAGGPKTCPAGKTQSSFLGVCCCK